MTNFRLIYLLPCANELILGSERRNLRKSTVDKAKETEERGKVLEAKTQLMKDFAKRKNLSDVRRLTQEELLAEAKITEKQNLRSLSEYYTSHLTCIHIRSPLLRLILKFRPPISMAGLLLESIRLRRSFNFKLWYFTLPLQLLNKQLIMFCVPRLTVIVNLRETF